MSTLRALEIVRASFDEEIELLEAAQVGFGRNNDPHNLHAATMSRTRTAKLKQKIEREILEMCLPREITQDLKELEEYPFGKVPEDSPF